MRRLFGLGWLGVILGTLLYEGFSGIDLAMFTESTPPPGEMGGLLNAIFGSFLMGTIAVAIGTPIGILAGTYLAEYGRYTRLAFFVRFVNDILLSAPSIVLGLFIYDVMVRPMGHFSAWAGAAALSAIVIPVVVRTTENMLLLIPNTLREAAIALGATRSHVIRHRDVEGRASGHRHRRAARDRAHLGRDRAAALHLAQQSVLEHQSE